MADLDVAAALTRVQDVLTRRPAAGLRDDAPGVARWDGGLRTVAFHPSGREVVTDMPPEFGGRGGEVSAGWMVRAGLAACTTTVIAMLAAMSGVELQLVEVEVTSRSDTRGFLRMAEGDGGLVYPGPQDMRMHVRIAADGVPAARLRELVEESQLVAPMLWAIRDAVPVAVSIETGPG